MIASLQRELWEANKLIAYQRKLLDEANAKMAWPDQSKLSGEKFVEVERDGGRFLIGLELQEEAQYQFGTLAQEPLITEVWCTGTINLGGMINTSTEYELLNAAIKAIDRG